ncbi:MAG TPA: xanthine dehydrogenase family protein molybdopterin-binding subunit [Vicinamibacterales bacterium]|nr:xanthine dehydrogenase family protein molybdopterin-binding subunit [Vicinamibacterales bacterium]
MASWPTTPNLLGKSTPRLDGPAKASGRAKYAYDIQRPGMLYGRIVRSPHAHARVRAIDLSAAAKASGVRAAIALLDVSQADVAKSMYQGDEIAAVAADTEEQARDAARLVKVDFEVLPHLATVEQAMRPEAPLVFPKGNMTAGSLEENGSLETGFASAAHTVEGLYSTQVQTHTCLETHGCVAEWEGDRLNAWVSTQAVHATANGVATALNIPATDVHIVTDYMGGGFGSKLGPDFELVTAAKLAREAKRPVKLMLDRKEEHLGTGNRPSAYAKVRAGVDAEGKFVAFDAETWGTGGAGQGAGFPLPYPVYVWPNRRRRHRDVYINAGPQRAMRAPGHPQGSFITEVVIDELADKAGIDPLQIRLKNLPPQEPNLMWGKYFEMGAEKIGWSRRHKTGDPAPGPIKRGLGCAANRWGGGGSPKTVGQVEVYPDGGALVRIGTQDIGTGTRTVLGLILAETFGLPLSAVKVEIGDSRYPFAPGSGGSVTIGSVSPVARASAEQALAALFAKVGPALGVDPTTLAARDSRVFVSSDPSRGMSWKEACKLLGTVPITINGQWEKGLSSVGTSGVQFADVEVDVETGVTRVKKIVCVQDTGLIIDKLTAESQCYGGIVMGIGFALFEHRILDRNTGRMVNPNMEWYLLPGPSDIPEIDVTLVDQPERGVIGLGEPPTISTAAAIANAVANAIGARVRSLPITPGHVLGALEQQRGGGTL